MISESQNSANHLNRVAEDIWSVSFRGSDTPGDLSCQLEAIEQLIVKGGSGSSRRIKLIIDFSEGGAFTSEHRRKLLQILGTHSKKLFIFVIKAHFRYRMALNIQLLSEPSARLVFTASFDEALTRIKELTLADYEVSDFVCPISKLNPRFAEKWLEKKETMSIGPYTLRVVEFENKKLRTAEGLDAEVVGNIIEGCCLHLRPSGYVDESVVAIGHNRMDDVIEEFGLRRGDFFSIVDSSQVKRFTLGARRKSKLYHQANQGRYKKAFVAAGTIPATLAKGAKLVSPDSFRDFQIVDTIEEAIQEIFEDRGWLASELMQSKPPIHKSTLASLIPFSRRKELRKFKEEQQVHIDRLCDILAQFAWEQEPPELTEIERDNSAFEPLYRLLNLVIQDFFSIFEDLRSVSEERLQLEARLRHSDKVLAIGTLAGGIAHDFNNILWIIQGNCERLLRRLEEDSSHRDFVNEVLISAARGKTLVDQILAFSRRRSLEKAPIQVAEALRESIALLRTTLPKTIHLVTVFHEGTEELCVLSEQAQLHQVLVNLGTNAYHAMGEKGVLTISLEALEFEFGQQEISPHAKLGPHALLKVTDTGSGISSDNLPRIFDPFFTTKEVGKGTGLGLSTVHGIVTAVGGFIEVESSLGVGSSFSIYWPTVEQVPGFCRSDLDDVASNHLPEKIIRSELESKRILLVDDEQPILSTVEGLLRDFGFEVVTCNDPLAARTLLVHDADSYDLLISDQAMPKLSGRDLIASLRENQIEIPAIILTGFSEEISEENFAKFGIQGYCRKPVTLSELRELLCSVLKL